MHDDGYTIRVMTREQVDMAIQWAADEGWNPGLHDAASFHAADQEGFLVGELNGRPIATISVVASGAAFGFLGFYIVHPDYRGRGYGLRLWEAGLARLGSRCVGLDGVVTQQDNYRRSGFELAYNNVRYQGQAGAAAPLSPDIVPLSALPFDELVDYDQPFYPGPRQAFLASWISQPGVTALGLLQGGGLAGYGVLRACRVGCKIGPLFADEPELAESLFQALVAHAPPGAPVFLDVPEPNLEAVALAARHGMQPVFETARMYRGASPHLPLGRLYGVTSFELG